MHTIIFSFFVTCKLIKCILIQVDLDLTLFITTLIIVISNFIIQHVFHKKEVKNMDKNKKEEITENIKPMLGLKMIRKRKRKSDFEFIIENISTNVSIYTSIFYIDFETESVNPEVYQIKFKMNKEKFNNWIFYNIKAESENIVKMIEKCIVTDKRCVLIDENKENTEDYKKNFKFEKSEFFGKNKKSCVIVSYTNQKMNAHYYARINISNNKFEYFYEGSKHLKTDLTKEFELIEKFNKAEFGYK